MMSRNNLLAPLGLLAAFAVLMALLLLNALPASTVAQTVEPCPTDSYPNPTDLDNCRRTATAMAESPSAYPNPNPSPSATATTGGGSQPAPPAATATTAITTTSAVTVTATLRPATPTLAATATRAPTAGQPQQQLPPTPTATSILSGLETVICAQDETVVVAGEAEPGTALLLYFNGRPVGGTLTRADGRYNIALRLGDERPGTYAVEVRERDGLGLVRQLACEVPGATPTPTAAIEP